MDDVATRTAALIDAALLAPSSHNTQPWLFHVEDGRIELRADFTRALPVNDPFDRELVISCGAALVNLLLAARNAGLDPVVDLIPEHDDPELMAVVTLRAGGLPTSEEEAMCEAVTMRRTHRDAFTDDPVDPAALRAMIDAARDGSIALTVVEDAELRARIAALVLAGDRRQFNDPHWRRELALWMHARRSGDGLPVGTVAGGATRAVVSHLDLGPRVGAKDANLVDTAPVLAVLTSANDCRETWLRAGQSLERALLIGAWNGVQAGFVNQPCQVSDLRSQLRVLLPKMAYPQMILRLGYPRGPVASSPRRTREAVLH
jgi:nitroreductase